MTFPSEKKHGCSQKLSSDHLSQRLDALLARNVKLAEVGKITNLAFCPALKSQKRKFVAKILTRLNIQQFVWTNVVFIGGRVEKAKR